MEYIVDERGVVLIRDPDPTTLTTPTLRPYTYDPTTLSTTPLPYPRPYDPEIAQLLFFAIHKFLFIHFARPFWKLGKFNTFYTEKIVLNQCFLGVKGCYTSFEIFRWYRKAHIKNSKTT